MRLKFYLSLAFATFLVATTGADLFARISIAGESFSAALREHLYYAGAQLVGTIFLLAPFALVALVCARAERHTHSRSVIVIFAIAMLTLLYFYFEGYQGAQHALLEQKWTAASLSIGLVAFFIGIPVVLGTTVAVALAAKLDRRKSA